MKTTNRFGRPVSGHLPLAGRRITRGTVQPLASVNAGKSLARRQAGEPRHQNQASRRIAENEILAAKNRLLATAVAHEFSTALNRIILTTNLIEKYYTTLTKQNILNEITGIKTAAMYMSAIIQDFRLAENIDKHGVQPVMTAFDLKDLTENVIGLMKHQTKDWQDIKYIHTGSSSHVSLDKDLLQHCLVNLISNAIKYSDVADHIEVGSEINGDVCRVWVKDYGIGIPEDEMGQLFEPFFRAKNALHIQGTGLGLNLVKRYAELMGGQVTVEKNGEKGTVVGLVFPVTPWHKTYHNEHRLKH